ncbi:uncharacterized protein LOC100679969 isoform X2 [Nasonia vitripennis]|uniref:Uncharacterized protein n=1 Tax=Nasonia vitripennis TaxID=7425 RepID=A0A7M7T8Q2_NASVI|nr:uncharacterized protein LOC100679969 isoform X2 [Nasonia vitripennis]
MKIGLLKNFLHCFQLRQGTILIAILQLVLSGFITIFIILGLTHESGIQDMIARDTEDVLEREALEEITSKHINSHRMELAHHNATEKVYLIYCGLVIIIVHFISTLLLLYGALMAHRVVKALRTESITNSLKAYNIKKPVLDNATRWNSAYLMLLSLIAAKPFCTDFGTTNKALFLTEKQREKISECVAALEPVKIATVIFQNEQLLPGDFYGAWLRCCLTVDNLNSPFAKDLHKAMKTRETQLFDNDALLSALYLDPRYMPIIKRNG